MKRFILVESDTEMYSLFASELEEVKPGVYKSTPESPIFCDSNRPVFFGAVSALLASKGTIQYAEPIALVPQLKECAPKIIVGVCREDNPRDVDETYGPGTYARLFPSDDDEPEEDQDPELCGCGELRTYVCKHGICKGCGKCGACYEADRHAESMSDHPEVQR